MMGILVALCGGPVAPALAATTRAELRRTDMALRLEACTARAGMAVQPLPLADRQ